MYQTLLAIPPPTAPAGVHEGVGSVAPPVLGVAKIAFTVFENGTETTVAAENASFTGATLAKSRLKVRVPPAAPALASVTMM